MKSSGVKRFKNHRVKASLVFCLPFATLMIIAGIQLGFEVGFDLIIISMITVPALLFVGEFVPGIRMVFESKMANVIFLFHRLAWVVLASVLIYGIWFKGFGSASIATDSVAIWLLSLWLIGILVIRLGSLLLFSSLLLNWHAR